VPDSAAGDELLAPLLFASTNVSVRTTELDVPRIQTGLTARQRQDACQLCSPRASILLNILHQRNSSVPYELRDAEMIDVLNLVKNYMCMESVKLADRLWLREWNGNMQHLGRVLTATYRLGYDDLVVQACHDIVWKSSSYTKVVDEYTMYGVEGDEALAGIFCEYQDNSTLMWETGWLTSLLAMLKDYKNKKLATITGSIPSLMRTFETTRDPTRLQYGGQICPESCLAAEVSAYELKQLSREHGLDVGNLGCLAIGALSRTLHSLPKFPFSDRYEPCSDTCVYHRLARAYNDNFLPGNLKELTLPRKLLCTDGYREHGFAGRSYYVGVGHFHHCGDQH